MIIRPGSQIHIIMKNTFISVLILISGTLTAQECKIDLHLLAQPDVNMIQLNKSGQSGLFNIVLSEGFDELPMKVTEWRKFILRNIE